MKLVITIPCLNEEGTLAATIADLPKTLPGIDEIEVLVIDDGSRDRTVEVARQNGAFVVSHTRNMGLARTFKTALHAALARGADIIVNTDADNQYRAEGIPALIAPILDRKAAVVLGCRPIETIPEFSALKKRLQRWGSRVVRRFSGVDVPDATTGFRAYSRDAALRLSTLTEFTYTLETLIQAGREGVHVAWTPIEVNPQTRPSRLFRTNYSYIKFSLVTMLRIYLLYRSLRVFFTIGFLFMFAAFALGVRFLVAYLTDTGAGHVQSLVLAATLSIIGFQLVVLAAISDMIAANRKLSAENLYWSRRAGLTTEGEFALPILPPFPSKTP